MDSFVVRVVDSIIQVEANPTVQTQVMRAEAAVTEAEAAAASAQANAGKVSPYITLPSSGSHLNRLVRVEIYKYVGITALTIPAKIGVRDFARDATSGGRFRLRLASFDGTSTYTEVAKESTNAFLAPTGYTGEIAIPLYASDTSFGVAANTLIGVAYVDFTDGSTFGTYAANNITWATAGLIRHRLTPSVAFDASVNGLVSLHDTVAYTAKAYPPFVTFPSISTSTTGRGALAVTRITIDPAYALGSANVMLWEAGRRSSDSFFRAQIGTYDGTSTTTILAATNNNNALNATGYTGIMVLPLTAQAGNTLGITAGTVIGEIEINFGTGAAFGTYAGKLTWAEGALVKTRIQESTAITQRLIDASLLAYNPSPLLSTVSDSYLRTIVEDIAIDNGVAGRTYVLNYRSDTTGSTRRLQFFLYDPVRGANVAAWAEQKSYDWASEVPESVYLSGASAGGVRLDYGIEYVGVGCTIFLKPGAVLFNKGASAFTTTAAGGINPNRVWSPEETERRILNGLGVRNKLRTFGTGGDFASLKLAVDSLLKSSLGAADDVQRSWWPFSDLCTPAHQWTLQAMPGHSEVKPAVIPSGVAFARGILCWMGMTIRLRSDTVIKGETTGGVDTYAIDYNLGGRIIMEPGALVWADSDVAVHSDAANALFIPSVANAADKTAGQQFFHIVGLIEGGRYKSDLQAWSCGVSDGCRIIFRRTVFETTGAGANWATHTSPSNVAPGYYEFDDVTLVGGTKSISLTTSNTVAARHGIRVTNSDVTSVSSGGAGYVRIGKQPGVTYSASLEP